ncbi:zinc-binding dehydrogenase [Streptomyces sp. NPDC054794]
MNLKRTVGSHGMNLNEAAEMMRLLRLGRVAPVLSEVYPLTEVCDAARLVQTNGHTGKVGVLALAPAPGLRVTDPQARAALGEEWLSPLRSTIQPAHAG